MAQKPQPQSTEQHTELATGSTSQPPVTPQPTQEAEASQQAGEQHADQSKIPNTSQFKAQRSDWISSKTKTFDDLKTLDSETKKRLLPKVINYQDQLATTQVVGNTLDRGISKTIVILASLFFFGSPMIIIVLWLKVPLPLSPQSPRDSALVGNAI